MTRIRVGAVEATLNEAGSVRTLAPRNAAWQCDDAELQRRLNKDLAAAAEREVYQPDWHLFAAERAANVFNAEILEVPEREEPVLDERGDPLPE